MAITPTVRYSGRGGHGARLPDEFGKALKLGPKAKWKALDLPKGSSKLKAHQKVWPNAPRDLPPLKSGTITHGGKTTTHTPYAKADVSKAGAWVPTNVLSQQAKPKPAVAAVMAGGAAAPAAGGVRGQGKAQAMGAASGQGASPSAKNAGIVPSQKPMKGVSKAKALKPKVFRSGPLASKGSVDPARPHRADKIYARTVSIPGHKGSLVANGEDVKDAKHARAIGQEYAQRKHGPFSEHSTSKMKEKVQEQGGRWRIGEERSQYSRRRPHGRLSAPGTQLAGVAAGTAAVGGTAHVAAVRHDKKVNSMSKADVNGGAPMRRVPPRRFDADDRRNRHSGEAMGAGTVVGAGAGVHAGRSFKHDNKPRLKFKGPKKISGRTAAGALIAGTALAGANQVRRSANDPRRSQRWN